MKKFLSLLVTYIIIFSTFLNSANASYAGSDEPSIPAEAAILMDYETGKVLFNKNGDKKVYPASTTKAWTAYLVLKYKPNLNEKVQITKDPNVEGSSMYLKVGESFSVKELLEGLLVHSSNDAAVVLAEYVSGSIKEFANLMNDEAKSIGAKNTHFTNPHGLPDKEHVTTANDMAKIMRFALNFDDFNRISRIISYQYVNHPYSDGTEKWATNRNNCYVDWSQWYYENLYCGKTGWTPEANHTYVATAVKDDEVLVASFLNAYNKDTQYTSVGQLFNWGFDNFNSVKLFNKGDIVGEYQISDNTSIPLLTNKDIYYTLSANEEENITTAFNYVDKDYSESSIKKGDVLFDATLIVNGEKYTTLELLSGLDREYTTKIKIENTINKYASNKIIISIILVLILSLCIYIYIRKRKLNKRRDFIRKKYNLDI